MPTAFKDKVLGIDLGTQNARVAILAPHQRMPDIVRNNFSIEYTPAVVAFDEERRHVGEEGLLKVTSRPKWAASLLRLLFSGKSSEELGLCYNFEDGVLKTPRGDFNLQQLLAMLFNVLISYARKIDKTEKAELPAKVVVSLPKCTPKHKETVTAGLMVLGMARENIIVVTDGTAAGHYYRGRRFEGLSKKLDEAQPVAVVDVGHGYSTITIVKAAKEGMEVLAESSKPVGSFSIDSGLLAKMTADIKQKDGQDFTSPKVALKPFSRLRKECTKVKEIMSTVQKNTLNETLTDSYDVKYETTADDIKGFAADLMSTLESSIAEALQAAGVKKEDLSEVEVIGGGWRTPCVQETLKRELGVETLAVHLDSAQTVAQGCALAGMWRLPESQSPKADEAGDESPASPVSETDEVVVNGVHYYSFDVAANEPSSDLVPLSEDELKKLQDVEAAIQKEEADYAVRMEARNKLEGYVLNLPSVGYDAKLSEAEMENLNAKVKEVDHWMLGEEGEAAGPEELLKKLDEVKEYIDKNFTSIKEHLEKVRLEEEEKSRKLEAAAREAKETKEPKTDPQRLKAARERKDQGVVLFKSEDYAQAITRFVQALAHLKDIYDLEKPENKKGRDELALSCHLNIASASIKLKKWQHAAKNCTQALEYDANSAKAYFRRGQAQRHLSEFKEAKKDLTKALELSGGDKAITKELELLEKQEADQKKKDKAMYSKMFGGM